MDLLHPTLFASIFNPDEIIATFGTLGLIIIIFLESCFAPLPGDSLLFTAGLFASKGDLNLAVILIGTTVAAIAGNQVGYWFGRRAGVALYNRPDGRFFKQAHLEKTHSYFDKYGPKTILLARLIPVVRGFAPIVAGIGRMNYRVFVTYNVIGGFLWCWGFILAGWWLGNQIDDIDKYVLPIVAVIIVVTSIPVVIEYYRAKKHFASTPTGQANHVIKEEVSPE